eukprot:TRINITY_DN7076_c1_g1_i2.p1 TRINITY_DN7076_c1_g1~~TRINITY_DN7076_c1_g1_i2.p1  ORF type:complete len:362 (+),score=32.51 TRINITY_DN7076_c1_g1_i2:86-1087(+)
MTRGVSRRENREFAALAALVPGYGIGAQSESASESTEWCDGRRSEAIFDILIRSYVREKIEALLPTLEEVLRETTYASGREMAHFTNWETRRQVQAFTIRDDIVVDEIWDAVNSRHQHESSWFDRDALNSPTATVKLTRKDLCTLSKKNWLNDEIINGYMSILSERSESLPEYPSTHAMSTHWYTKLTSRGFNYAAVKRWTRKVDVFSKAGILIPINVSNSHWTLCHVDLEQCRISYHDSLGGCGNSVLQNVHRWLTEEHQTRHSTPLPLAFSLINFAPTPRQENAYDCGVFTCCAANCLSARRGFSYTQKDMPYIRRRMVLELLLGRVPIPL